jgi:predicted DNA-binding transcriptional regulator AlpA
MPENARKLLDVKEAAEYLGVAVQTLANYRSKRVAPNYIKIGKRVLYDQPVLDQFIDARRINLE